MSTEDFITPEDQGWLARVSAPNPVVSAVENYLEAPIIVDDTPITSSLLEHGETFGDERPLTIGEYLREYLGPYIDKHFPDSELLQEYKTFLRGIEQTVSGNNRKDPSVPNLVNPREVNLSGDIIYDVIKALEERAIEKSKHKDLSDREENIIHCGAASHCGMLFIRNVGIAWALQDEQRRGKE